MKKLILSMICGLFIAPVSHAGIVDIWQNCGLGAMIFKKEDQKTFALISNIIWDLGTTGTTSHLASPDACKGRAATAGKFILKTYANIEKQTALGNGDHLASLMNIMGCDASAQSSIINGAREYLRSSVQQSDYNQMSTNKKAEGYYKNIMSNVEANHANKCALI